MNKENNSNNNNNSCNNSCNNDNEYNIKLYNSVFNNIVIKRIIFHHLNIFNLLFPLTIGFRTIKELQQFKYKDYLNKIQFTYSQYINQLPSNISSLRVPPPSRDSNINQILDSIPNHIVSLGFMTRLQFIEINLDLLDNKISGSTSTISKLKSLKLDYSTLLHLNPIPSITSLTINGSNITLKKNQLPSNLIILKCEILKSFEDGCLPESLTRVAIYNTVPLFINQLSSNGLIKLHIGCNQDIGRDIRFPNTLQYLNISSCRSFNATLPSGLKSFAIGMFRYEYEIQFPSSIEHLDIAFDNNLLNQDVFKSLHSVPVNLKSLKIQCSSIVDSSGHPVLPDSLETLNLKGFNQVLKENQLPSSLTHLDIDSLFNYTIDINVLPSSLNKLELPYDYSQVINPLAIPSSLQLLTIRNSNYDHPIKLTPSSHPNTVVDCDNLNLYYNQTNTDIRVLKLPYQFESPLSTLQLQDKCNLNYLHLGYEFDHPIQLSDLPINNQIKTLELSFRFTHTINLEYFQNLESIIINDGLNNKSTIITTTINDNGTYNYYKLKEIHISSPNGQFIKQLDIHFYKFIKLIKAPIINNKPIDM